MLYWSSNAECSTTCRNVPDRNKSHISAVFHIAFLSLLPFVTQSATNQICDEYEETYSSLDFICYKESNNGPGITPVLLFWYSCTGNNWIATEVLPWKQQKVLPKSSHGLLKETGNLLEIQARFTEQRYVKVLPISNPFPLTLM